MGNSEEREPERDGRDVIHLSDHPHAAFHYGLAQHFRACARERDDTLLVLMLAGYVDAWDGPDGKFNEEWEALQHEAGSSSTMSNAGVGEGTTYPELRVHEFGLIMRHARRLGFFDPFDKTFKPADLERLRAQVGGRR